MQHRSKHNSIIWAWHNRAKLKFLSDIHWLNTIQYFIAKLAVFWHVSTKLNGLSCLAGLLSGPCSFLLPDVQTWICTLHTQDLKPTVLPQNIDEMRSRSSMAKKTHSHSPPLSLLYHMSFSPGQARLQHRDGRRDARRGAAPGGRPRGAAEVGGRVGAKAGAGQGDGMEDGGIVAI